LACYGGHSVAARAGSFTLLDRLDGVFASALLRIRILFCCFRRPAFNPILDELVAEKVAEHHDLLLRQLTGDLLVTQSVPLDEDGLRSLARHLEESHLLGPRIVFFVMRDLVLEHLVIDILHLLQLFLVEALLFGQLQNRLLGRVALLRSLRQLLFARRLPHLLYILAPGVEAAKQRGLVGRLLVGLESR